MFCTSYHIGKRVSIVAAALVLLQLALLASAFMGETAVSTGSVQAVVPADGDVDGASPIGGAFLFLGRNGRFPIVQTKSTIT